MMYTKQPKKLTIMNILDILKRYTDENHRLSQKEIQDVKFSDESDQQITVTADVNELAMEQFAKAYTPYVEIIKPVSLRERMMYNLSAGIKQYNVKGSGVN